MDGDIGDITYIIDYFDNSVGINVPRSRFLPVKKTSDLLLVKSNLYTTNEAGALMMNPTRQFATTPLVQLSGPYFWKVSNLYDSLNLLQYNDVINREN